MSYLFRYVWAAKVCLTGWSTYRACVGESSNLFICGISSSYFLILLFATLCTCRWAPKPQELDNLEGEYLRRLEEGFSEQQSLEERKKQL